MSDILKNALTNHIKKNAFQIQVLRATVNSYDKKSRTCNVTLDNGVEIEDILIQPISNFDKGLIVFPAKNSKVLLEKIEAQNMALRICSYTEIAEVEMLIGKLKFNIDEVGKIDLELGNTKIVIDNGEILFNSGTNKGLVRIEPLVNKINELEADINNLKMIFSVWTPIPTDGGAALKSIVQTWSGNKIATTQINQLENSKIKH